MPNTFFYPTASTCAVFINGQHVEQAYRIDYRDSVPKTPIFGYNDYEFTQVVRGKGLINGILLVNFTVPFYLTHVLDGSRSSFNPRLYNYNITPKDISTTESFVEKVSYQLHTELPANINGREKEARAEFIAKLLDTKNSKNKVDVKKALYDFFVTPSNEPQDKRPEGGTVDNPLTVEPKSLQGNTIDVYYHDPDYINWFIRFNCVTFTDVSQQISQAGAEGSSEPLYEIYNFIAKNKEIKLIG